MTKQLDYQHVLKTKLPKLLQMGIKTKSYDNLHT